MTRKDQLHRMLTRILWLTIIILILWFAGIVNRSVPDRLSIVEDETEELHFNIPLQATIHSESAEVVLSDASNIPARELHLSPNQPFFLYSQNQGKYELALKLFGWIEWKTIEVDVVDSRYVVPCGVPVGIYLKSDGILVIGTGELSAADGTTKEPAAGVLRTGDYIQAINGHPLKDKETLITEVNAIQEGEARLTVRRDGSPIEVSLHPVSTSDGSYKLGAWVRDDTQGIGTMTYMDVQGNFGALGHGISDSDTGDVVEIEHGALYETSIVGIEKGTLGTPGVMSGVIYYGPGTRLGEITSNTDVGIFGTAAGTLAERMSGESIPVAHRQEVTKGEAVLRSSISGEIRDYKIEILKVDPSSSHRNKGIVIRVVDEELLKLTGGIVQGMSGSPIIQNGKLAGAVTHVFIQDSTRGYGVFAETMVEEEGRNLR